MNKRIYIKQWLELKPYEKQTATDTYYLKLSNNVKKVITTIKQSIVLQRYIDKENIDILSCFLTSYFEDLISETNIWNAFVKTHQQLYKKYLPFYILDEYYEKEINPQDISFLIWYFLNTLQEDVFITPFSNFIKETAEKVFDVFDNAWDNAPENRYLKSIYRIDTNEEDFYVARNLIDTILFKTYLFYPDTLSKLRKQELAIIEDIKDDENILSFLNENRDRTLHTTHTRLLSLKGKEWASQILGNNHPLSKDFSDLSQKISGFFLYKGQDNYNIFIEHIASSKEFELTKKSFDHSDTLNEIDTILYMGIIRWKNEWWFSGIFFKQPFSADLILDEKNSIESRMTVNFLDHRRNETEETLNMQFNAFKEFNEGKQIAFIKSEKIDNFVKAYIEYFNNSLGISDKEKEEAIERARKEGFFVTEKDPTNYAEASDTGLVFFNPKSGIEIALSVNSAFPLPNNPFFNIEDSENDFMFLLVSDQMSKELALYCIDNCKRNLPFFNDVNGKIYLRDIDFLLRFWKKNNYFSKPAITFTGERKKQSAGNN